MSSSSSTMAMSSFTKKHPDILDTLQTLKRQSMRKVAEAYEKMINDSEFLADAKKRKFEIDPNTGAEVQVLAEKLLAIPPGVVEAAKAALQAN